MYQRDSLCYILDCIPRWPNAMTEEERLCRVFAERCIRDWYRSEPKLSEKLKELKERRWPADFFPRKGGKVP